ncbi:hypothetical protein [uncultured Phenylobacterium sp.]|uniref:hypothetical protein n=1 Tax=uncultured Phenylobacterium sp. TaxID=349273 RepID=UPI0025E2F603|nr:hypothetical protein [uncultured Phenylobacterium sp.]
MESTDQALLYLLDLRLQARGRPEATRIIDRCLRLLTQSRSADPATLAGLDQELQQLREDLERRFGPPKAHRIH